MPNTFYGNPNGMIGGLGYMPQLQSTFKAGNLPNQAKMGLTMFNPNATMYGSGKTVGYGSPATANALNKQFLPKKPKGQSFNPYAVGAQVLGSIGGGQRANIGNDVWETGGQLSGTGVGNMSDQLGDIASQFGPTGALVGLGLKGAADIANLIAYDPEVTDIDTGDQFMREGGPVLQIGDKIGAAHQIDDNAKKMAGQGALAGGKTGAAIGTAIMPGVGTAIGAGLGALGGFLLGDRKKNRAMEAYREAMGEIDETTNEFNQKNITHSREQYGQERLAQRLSRERNPYLVGYNSPFTV